MKACKIQSTSGVILLVACLATPPSFLAAEPADLVLYNGKVFTVDDSNSVHQAIAVRGDQIVAVGGNDLPRQFDAKKTIDLEGQTVIPGFNDTHTHIRGEPQRHIDLTGVHSIGRLQELVRAKVHEMGEGQWITGYGWSEDVLGEKRRPLRGDLDEAAPRNPVILTRQGGHSAVVNSLALRLAGVDKNTPNPEVGVIERNELGELNGIIREAQGIVSRLVPQATREELRASFVEHLRDQLRLDDLLTIDDSGIMDVVVDMTILGGKIVFDRKAD